MATIHDIPVEILTKIFEYLTPSDRRVASQVNRYWQYIWNTPTLFDTDRTLIFNDCVIRSGCKPASVFRKTNRRYYKIIIGHVEFEDGFVEMWTRLGKTIKFLEFDRTFVFNKEKHSEFLQYFPNLKIMKINFEYWKRETFQFDMISSTIEKLILNFGPYYGSTKAFEKLILYSTGLNELELENIELNDEVVALLPSIMCILTKLKIKVYSHQIQNLKKIRAPNLTHLSVKEFGSELHEILSEVLERLWNLQNFELSTRDVMPPKNIRKLGTLKVVNLEYYPECMSSVKFFGELEELDVSIWEDNDSDCFFGHNVYKNYSIKVFKLVTHKNQSCPRCIETIVRSFPLLERFEIDLKLTGNQLTFLYENMVMLKNVVHKTVVDSA
uniref:CSON006869 protein n=1 Tax=Culicoides sonorensis TaxID=179676 RepID=A0A336LZP1_CULSO